MRIVLAIFFLSITLPLLAEQQPVRETIEEALTQYKDLDSHPQLLLLERSLQKAEAAFKSPDTTTAKVYMALSEWYTKNAEFDSALQFGKKHLATQIELAVYTDRTAEAYTHTGERYVDVHKFDKAGEHFQRSLELNKGRVKNIDFRNYKGMATVLLSQGNFNIQIEHGKYAYDLAETPDEKCRALHVQFQGYARLGDIDSCLEKIEEQLSISKQHKLNFARGRAYTSLGWVHYIKARRNNSAYKRQLALSQSEEEEAAKKAFVNKSSNYKKQSIAEYKNAITYYDKGVSFMKGSGHQNEVRQISWAYKNISNQYKSLGKMELSIQYAKLAIQENRAFFGKQYYPELADLFHNLSTKYSLKAKYGGPEDFEAALRQIQNAIKCLLDDEDFSDTREVIPTEKLHKVGIKWQLLTELKEKALCYAQLYINHENRADVESAEKHLANAVELIDIMRAQLSTDNTKIYWRRNTRVIYDTAVEMADWLKDDEKVFKYMEKSRALLLLDDLNHNDAKSLIPADLADRELELRDAFLDTKETDLVKYTEYNEFLDSLKLAFPHYYKYKFDVSTPTIAEVQKDILDDSTQVLSYHITPDSLYLLNITSEESKLITSPRPFNLRSKVNELISLVGNKDSLEYQHNFDRFITLSSELNKILLTSISENHNKVIVIGDGVINFVPFDILVSNVESGVPRYQIEDYTFSMAPSMTVLQKYNDKKYFNKLLLVSPGTFDFESMLPLKQSDEEIANLERISSTSLL